MFCGRMLGLEARASCMLGKHYNTDLCPQFLKFNMLYVFYLVLLCITLKGLEIFSLTQHFALLLIHREQKNQLYINIYTERCLL